MSISRRGFVSLAAATLAADLLAENPRATVSGDAVNTTFKAIVFDALAIFDPKPVFDLLEMFFPSQGAALSNEWRTRQFEYTWLRIAEKRYADFGQVTQDALVYATNKLKVNLSPQQRDELMKAYVELKTWPDVAPALTELKKSRYRLAILSNFTPQMLDGCIRNAKIDRLFDQVLSTDQAKTFKPDPRAYQLGTDILKLNKQEILFVAFAGWDAAGAKAFGYPTFWVNRLKLPGEELGEVPDGIGSGLSDLVQYLAR